MEEQQKNELRRCQEREASMAAYFKRRQEEVTQEVLAQRKLNKIKMEWQCSWVI